MPILTGTGGGPLASFIVNSSGGQSPDFPAALNGLIQQGFLERELQEGLDSRLAYRREVVREMIPNRVGETVTKTRKGRKAPVTTPMDPHLNSGLDNGLTPTQFSIEQYQLTLQEWGDTVEVNLMQELASIGDTVVANARNNGVQAAQTLEVLAQAAAFNAYMGGNTIVLSSPAPTTTSIHVDDIRGFLYTLANGVLVPVSSTNPIPCSEKNIVSGGQNQNFNVTAAVADATNISGNAVAGGISGTLTISGAAAAPVAGDAIIANNAARIIRPLGKWATAQLNAGDVLTLGNVRDGVAYLRSQSCPPMKDGTYHMILDDVNMSQLLADQQFQVAYAGRYQSEEYQEQEIVRFLGTTYITTTQAYVQPPSSSSNPTVRRPLMLGAESIIEGDFEGMMNYLRNTVLKNALAHVEVVNGVVQIVRAPLDRLQQILSMSWTWVGGFAVPTDVTATTAIIPTASNSQFKRGIVFETAG